MVPTPYYGGFDLDICSRAKVKIYPVDCSSVNNYIPTIKLLEDTLTKARNEVQIYHNLCSINCMTIFRAVK